MMDEDIEFAVAANRWSLRLLGIWPIPDYFSDTRFFLAMALILSLVILQCAELFQNRGLNDAIDNFSSSIPCSLVLVKLLIVRMNRTRLQECLNTMFQDWEWKQYFKKEFKDVMVKNARMGRMLNIACTILLYATALGFLTLPFTVPEDPIPSYNSTRQHPAKAIYPFDVSSSPIFEMIYISQCLSIVAGATSNFSIDSFLALLVLHFCGQLEILGKTLEGYNGRIGHSSRKQEYFGCCDCMVCIVERHLHITRFSEILEASFNVMLLVQLIGNSMLFCFLGYRIIMNFEDSQAIGLLTFVVFMFTMMFHLFIYSYVGEQIMEKGGEIGYSAYKVDWYNLRPNETRPLIILMARSRIPLKITAGKFFTMSLETYTDIMKTSVGYLSFLRAVNNQD